MECCADGAPRSCGGSSNRRRRRERGNPPLPPCSRSTFIRRHARHMASSSTTAKAEAHLQRQFADPAETLERRGVTADRITTELTAVGGQHPAPRGRSCWHLGARREAPQASEGGCNWALKPSRRIRGRAGGLERALDVPRPRLFDSHAWRAQTDNCRKVVGPDNLGAHRARRPFERALTVTHRDLSRLMASGPVRFLAAIEEGKRSPHPSVKVGHRAWGAFKGRGAVFCADVVCHGRWAGSHKRLEAFSRSAMQWRQKTSPGSGTRDCLRTPCPRRGNTAAAAAA